MLGACILCSALEMWKDNSGRKVDNSHTYIWAWEKIVFFVNLQMSLIMTYTSLALTTPG